MSDKEEIIRFEVDNNTVFPSGHSRSDIRTDVYFGKKRKYIDVKVNVETAMEFRKMEENEHKKAQRANKCVHRKNGECDGENCEYCDFYCNSGEGSGNLSLEQMVHEFGDIFEDATHKASPEKELMKAEFWKTFDEAVGAMSDAERTIAIGILLSKREKEVMSTLGITSQSIFSKKKRKVRDKLCETLADFNLSDFSD